MGIMANWLLCFVLPKRLWLERVSVLLLRVCRSVCVCAASTRDGNRQEWEGLGEGGFGLQMRNSCMLILRAYFSCRNHFLRSLFVLLFPPLQCCCCCCLSVDCKHLHNLRLFCSVALDEGSPSPPPPFRFSHCVSHWRRMKMKIPKLGRASFAASRN